MTHLTLLSELRNTVGTVACQFLPVAFANSWLQAKWTLSFSSGVYSAITDGFHTCAVTPAFFAENFGLGAVNKEDVVDAGLENAE